MSCILLADIGSYRYVIENGYIRCYSSYDFLNYHTVTGDYRERFKKKMIEIEIPEYHLRNVLDSCVRKKTAYLVERIINYTTNRDARREREKKRNWITDVTDGMVLIVEKHIDFRANSFSVRMSLKQLPFEDQVSYVKNNVQKLYDVLIKYLSENKSAMRQIRDFKFYYVSNVTVTRASEVEFLFSLKPGIEEALNA